MWFVAWLGIGGILAGNFPHFFKDHWKVNLGILEAVLELRGDGGGVSKNEMCRHHHHLKSDMSTSLLLLEQKQSLRYVDCI